MPTACPPDKRKPPPPPPDWPEPGKPMPAALDAARLGGGNAVTWPRPRRTPAGELAARLAVAALWAVLWFGVGLLVGGLFT